MQLNLSVMDMVKNCNHKHTAGEKNIIIPENHNVGDLETIVANAKRFLKPVITVAWFSIPEW